MKPTKPTHAPTAEPLPAAPTAAPELPLGDCAALLGLDWGDERHAIALVAHGSQTIETLEVAHTPETLHAWLEQLHARFGGQPVAVAVEASKGAIVAALLEHPWLLIYPVHPATSRRFSTAFVPSGAKDDVPDAQVLLEILRYHRGRLRALLPHDEATRRLAHLAEARRTVVDRRTLLSNQLTSLLKNYFPQALALTGDKRYAPLALDFVERWPELALLQRARPQTVRAFYHAHRVRRPETIEARLASIPTARPLTSDRALIEVSMLKLQGLVAELRVLARHLIRLDEALERAFAAHAEAPLFTSLPGAGAAMAPRLSVLFGTDRARWQNAEELQTYYGIAPVTKKSGRQKTVHWRWNAPVFARQTLVEWTGQTVKYSPWAKAYYQQQQARHRHHAAIIRSLAFKWLRILWKCWRERKPYDEDRYLKRLTERNPTLYALIPTP
jgi:transposase